MLSILDRYILRSLLINYLIAIGAMISLYVVLDLFVNMDEFTEQGYPLTTVVKNIISYYAPNVLLYYAQLSGVITLFACMASLARMRKLNELTAILASGVSLYRVAAPIVAFGIATTGILIVDTEILIPGVAHLLSRDHDDADGTKAYEVLFLRDHNGDLLSAAQFHPTRHDLKKLLLLQRDESGAMAGILAADHAEWEPPTPVRPMGRWVLDRGRQRVRTVCEDRHFGPSECVEESFPRYYETDLGPDEIQLRQSEGWLRFLSLKQLREVRGHGTADTMTALQTKHTRIATPIVAMILLLLGLPCFLDRSPANILRDAGRCVGLCGLCYVVTFVAQSIRPASESALPAWIPIFIFATVAMVLIDRIRT